MNFSITALKPKQKEHYLLLSILLYTLGKFIGMNIDTTVGLIISTVGLLIFIYRIINFKKSYPYTGPVDYFLRFLIIDILLITIYSFFVGPDSLFNKSFYDFWFKAMVSKSFLPSLMPIVAILFFRNYQFDFKYLIRIILFLSIIYLIISPFALYTMYNYEIDRTLIHVKQGEYAEFHHLSTFHIALIFIPPMMYFLKKYITKRQWWIFLSVCIIQLIIYAYSARRGATAMSLLYFLSCYMLYLVSNKTTSKYLLLLIGACIVFIIYQLFIEDSEFFQLLKARGDLDTRTGVEEEFWKDVGNDPISFWFGRGWYGTYFDNQFKDFREGIETGYLTLILRGGIIYLILYIGVLVLSGLRGLFKSKNLLVKSFSLVILLSVVELYPFGWPEFTFKYFLIWFGVYICNSKYYLNMSDKQVKSLFFD